MTFSTGAFSDSFGEGFDRAAPFVIEVVLGGVVAKSSLTGQLAARGALGLQLASKSELNNGTLASRGTLYA